LVTIFASDCSPGGSLEQVMIQDLWNFAEAHEDDRLIADKAFATIDYMREMPFRLKARLATNYQETADLMQSTKTRKIGETDIQEVENANFRHQLVEDVDFA